MRNRFFIACMIASIAINDIDAARAQTDKYEDVLAKQVQVAEGRIYARLLEASRQIIKDFEAAIAISKQIIQKNEGNPSLAIKEMQPLVTELYEKYDILGKDIVSPGESITLADLLLRGASSTYSILSPDHLSVNRTPGSNPKYIISQKDGLWWMFKGLEPDSVNNDLLVTLINISDKIIGRDSKTKIILFLEWYKQHHEDKAFTQDLCELEIQAKTARDSLSLKVLECCKLIKQEILSSLTLADQILLKNRENQAEARKILNETLKKCEKLFELCPNEGGYLYFGKERKGIDLLLLSAYSDTRLYLTRLKSCILERREVREGYREPGPIISLPYPDGPSKLLEKWDSQKSLLEFWQNYSWRNANIERVLFSEWCKDRDAEEAAATEASSSSSSSVASSKASTDFSSAEKLTDEERVHWCDLIP